MPIQPVRIRGAREALPRGSGRIRFSRITVTVGPPIVLTPDERASAKGKADYDRIAKRIMAAIEDGLYQPSMKDRLATLKSEKATLSSLLEQTPEPPALRLHPSLSDLYRSKVRKLSEALNEPGLKREATEVLRGLISEVRMIPDADAPNGHRIELAGELAGILALGGLDTTKPPRCEGFKSETMVAGVGFEPTTFRL